MAWHDDALRARTSADESKNMRGKLSEAIIAADDERACRRAPPASQRAPRRATFLHAGEMARQEGYAITGYMARNIGNARRGSI